MDPAAMRLIPGPLTGAGSTHRPAPLYGKYSTGEQAANSGRQLSYAVVGAAYYGVVAGRPVKEANAGVVSWAPLTH
jgi:hypothetical protein